MQASRRTKFLTHAAGQMERSPTQIVREYWANAAQGAGFRNLVAQSRCMMAWWPIRALPAKTLALKSGWAASAQRNRAGAQGLEIVFRPDPTIVRWAIREQRLAAGTPKSDHAA